MLPELKRPPAKTVTIDLPAQIFNFLNRMLPADYRFRFGTKQDVGKVDNTLIFFTMRQDQVTFRRGADLSLRELVRLWRSLR